jgi:cyclohexadieny/prephenate dehydrogenase
MNTSTLTIVGVGLLGGSLALAARKRKLAATVIGVGRNIDRLEPARAKGVIDEVATDLTDAARRSDMMIFCSPVDQIASQVLRAAQNCSPSCLLTDVGSTKRRIVETVEQACGSHTLFVGSHPLAGSEKQGWQFADSDLFVGRTVVITATAHTPRAAAKQATEFWNALGSLVVEMDPAEHDRILAKTSHLPHLVAAALATSLCLKSGETKLSANGLRDTTRIASGDPALWTAILWENRQEVARGLESFQDSVNDWRTALNAESPAAIRVLLEQGKQSRDALGN